MNDDDIIQRLQSQISRATGREVVILTPQSQYSLNRMNDEPSETRDKRNQSTAMTEDESFDGPDASFSDVSRRYGSVVSSPETIRFQAFGADQPSFVDTPVHHRKDRGVTRTLSWDTMDLTTMRHKQVGQPLRALQSLTSTDSPIPDEVMIMTDTYPCGSTDSLTDRLKDAERRIDFLEDKLEKSNDLVEDTFRDLERARLCIHDLVQRNVHMNTKLKEQRREDTKKAYEIGEVLVEQHWLLKGSLYMSLFFFVSGGHELFLASTFFVWLSLETNFTV